jgi:hypothetical protein
MKVAIQVPSCDWERLLQRVSERMGCPGDYEEVFMRSFGLAAAVTHHLQEEGATVQLLSPRLGPSTLMPGPLYGRGPGLDAAMVAERG